MQYVDEFRDPELAKALLRHIQTLVADMPQLRERPLQLMEVCGGHTHAIFKFGLDRLLPPEIEFIHGPGCPVCVLPMGRIDACLEIASHPDVIFCTFGDAMRVPGRNGSLQDARRHGADVRIVYSPLDALDLAEKNPHRQVVFFGLGFETTMPSTALTLQQAKRRHITNFTLFCQHITIIPTLRSLLQQPDLHIDGFLAPGHVSMVIGAHPYQPLCDRFHKPFVVTGFEPLDILQALLMLVAQIHDARCEVENQYRRIVPDSGNLLAQQAMDDVFETKSSSEWRGLGEIADSGMQLRAAYADFDAERRFHPQQQRSSDEPESRCGDVLTGRCKPADCPLFAKRCTPQNAIGALMVSSEGACAAYYQYRRECA
ncbi:hydrogenase formation protein HypD [Brenneria goodwinii]|uniref:Hydrogenase maturation factor n=1 Tax=Brenneria goodwinii TaxID=1109412 RepID=A0A0G4JXT3_9GAMM|nr:hydrogenase formation protein HypD [Brenneria goodwinii]ATA23211.1 hydrogenase isoenzyme formation protein HypD [Brenneria goodwinii]MCG8157509.1 hydrogenase formation protein HypD [Brenneria goodwinii]MCG8162082.1 hydrogenase formation protein HypD [Brenneria goodwinii]MCG8165323.1 hydrogenase formation protein HypD [Brenneria goodwinii]MCG8171020.1 hydrogenase formation protein HypD [Brenneria goodwinii]